MCAWGKESYTLEAPEASHPFDKLSIVVGISPCIHDSAEGAMVMEGRRLSRTTMMAF